jgi:metal-responsive CopG/Arc/MetJ family transcriptional regulator
MAGPAMTLQLCHPAGNSSQYEDALDNVMAERPTKSLTISLPPAMVEELDRVRTREHRTRSGLMREALRRYVAADTAGHYRPPAEDATPGEIEAIGIGAQEFARGETSRLEDLQNELGLPTR